MKTYNLVDDSFYKAGVLKGSYFKEKVDDLRENLYKFKESGSYLKNKILFYALEKTSLLSSGFGILKRAEKDFPEIMEFFSGMVEGGIDDSIIVLTLVMESVVSKLLALGNCSAFVKWENEKKILGKNFDFLNYLKGEIYPELRKGKNFLFWGTSIPTLPSVIEGMNEEGLTIAYNYGYSKFAGKFSTPISFYITKALGEMEFAEEFVDFLNENLKDIPNGAIVSVVDKNEVSYVVEISPPDKISCLREDEFFRSNIYANPELESFSIEKDKRFSKLFPIKWYRGKFIQESNIKRFERGKEILKRKNSFSILKDHGNDGVPSENTICRHSPTNPTLFSFLAIPKERKIYFKDGFPCSGEYEEFLFKSSASIDKR